MPGLPSDMDVTAPRVCFTHRSLHLRLQFALLPVLGYGCLPVYTASPFTCLHAPTYVTAPFTRITTFTYSCTTTIPTRFDHLHALLSIPTVYVCMAFGSLDVATIFVTLIPDAVRRHTRLRWFYYHFVYPHYHTTFGRCATYLTTTGYGSGLSFTVRLLHTTALTQVYAPPTGLPLRTLPSCTRLRRKRC